MSLPPKDVPAGELWQRLTERPRPAKVVDFPAKGHDGQPIGEVKLWILTESELQSCRVNAERHTRKLLRGPDNAQETVDPTSQGYQQTYYNELQVQLVSAACRQVSNPLMPAFLSAKDARQRLTTDEFGVLAKAYATWRVEAGPVVAEMTKEELEAWVKLLMEGGSLVPLASLSLEALQELLRHLVLQLKTSPTASGSVGSQQDESYSEAAPLSDLTADDELERVKE